MEIANAEKQIGGIGEALDAESVVLHQPGQVTTGAPIRSILLSPAVSAAIAVVVHVMAPFMGQHRQRQQLLAGLRKPLGALHSPGAEADLIRFRAVGIRPPPFAAAGEACVAAQQGHSREVFNPVLGHLAPIEAQQGVVGV